MKNLIVVTLIWVLLQGALMADTNSPNSSFSTNIEYKLNTITISNVHWDNQPLTNVLVSLRQKIIDNDPEHVGIQIVINRVTTNPIPSITLYSAPVRLRFLLDEIAIMYLRGSISETNGHLVITF